MSADLLRRAAVRITHDVEFGQGHGDPDFLLATADLLQVTARDVGTSSTAYKAALAVARAYLGGQS